MISPFKKSVTALKDRMRTSFASTQPKKSHYTMTKYLKPLQGGI